MQEMVYRKLGCTGLTVSVIGFGAAPLRNEFGTVNGEEGQRAVHNAIERGINYFDVSPYYGRTLAETRLGEALVGHRDKVVSATNMGWYVKDLESGFDFSAGRALKSVDESLRRLQTDYIDVFQIHDIEFCRFCAQRTGYFRLSQRPASFPCGHQNVETRRHPFIDLITATYPLADTAAAFGNWDAAPDRFSKMLIDLA